MKLQKLVGVLLAALCSHAMADTSEIKTNLENAFHLKIESVEQTKYNGLYEVVTEDTILYTDDKGSFVIAGSLIDTKTLEDVTEVSMKKLAVKDFAKLPLDKAIKTVYGKGERTLVTFEDPNCGYCKRLYKETSQLDNVTVYTFLVPILGKDSVKKTSAIWCSKDPSAAWKAWMKDGEAPAEVSSCDKEPTKEVMTYARKIQLQGTPVLLMANGERMNGYGNKEMIEQMLSK